MRWALALFALLAVLLGARLTELESLSQATPAQQRDLLLALVAEPQPQDDPETVELAINLEAIDLECELTDEFAGSARLRWAVEGGQPPYEVWVNGDLLTGASGVVSAPCLGLRSVDFRTWQRTEHGLPLTVVGTVIDSDGLRASDLLLIKRPGATTDTPENETIEFAGGVDSLTVELFAPNICDALEWGRYSRIPFADTGIDDITMEVEWRVSGGQPPYTVYLAGEQFVGDSGKMRVQCRHFQDGALDSGWLTVMAFAGDSVGAVGSGIVETFALARASGTAQSPERFLNPGQIYRFEGILMTIPEGLTFDLEGDGFASLIGECVEGSVCEPYFRLETIGESLVVFFGYRTRTMYRPVWIWPEWVDDPAVNASSREDLDEMIDQWEASLGQPPDLSGARWLNSAPLKISAFADPIICDPVDQIGRVYITVAGGGWTPTGVELDGKLVGLARGSGILGAYTECSEPAGTRSLRLNVHDLGPETDTSIAETDLAMQFPPLRHGEEILKLGTQLKYGSGPSPFDPTAYCAPGSKARVKWNLRGAVDPVEVRVNGMPVHARQGVWLNGWYATSGQLWIDCQQELGTQIVTIQASDSSTPPQMVELLVPLQIVEEHPSGWAWSEILPDDYPE